MEKHLRTLPEGFQSVASIVGLDKAIELTKSFGGSMIYVPTYNTATRYSRNEKIKADYRNGFSYNQLSKRYGLSEVAIRNITSSCDSQ